MRAGGERGLFKTATYALYIFLVICTSYCYSQCS